MQSKRRLQGLGVETPTLIPTRAKLGRDQPHHKRTTGKPKARLNQTKTVRTQICGGGLEYRNLFHSSKGRGPVLDGRLNVFSAVADNAISVHVSQAVDH
jgi:hypothetical protein